MRLPMHAYLIYVKSSSLMRNPLFENDLLNRKQLQDFHTQFLTSSVFWFSAALAAMISVGYTKVFSFCEEWALRQDPSFLLVATPVALLGSFLIAHFFSKEAVGSGIPQIIASMKLSENPDSPILARLLGFKMLVAKIFGSCLVALGGGVTGREGPTLQVSGAIFFQVHRLWPKKLPKPKLPAMVLAGGSAGLAAAFNTPLGGIVFAIEELSKSHIGLVRTSIFQAVIISGFMAQYFLGNYVFLGPTTATPVQGVFLQTILLSILIGLVGAWFSEALTKISRIRVKSSFYKKLGITILFSLLLAAWIYHFGHVAMGSGKKVLIDIIQNPVPIDNPFNAISRVFGNFLTYGAGVIGGVFAPSLASGATLAQYFSSLFGFASIKILSLTGMVAFLTAVTRSPFTATILVLEMSDTHEVILYLMLASLVSNGVARLVSKESFYERLAQVFLPEGEQSATPAPKNQNQ